MKGKDEKKKQGGKPSEEQKKRTASGKTVKPTDKADKTGKSATAKHGAAGSDKKPKKTSVAPKANGTQKKSVTKPAPKKLETKAAKPAQTDKTQKPTAVQKPAKPTKTTKPAADKKPKLTPIKHSDAEENQIGGESPIHILKSKPKDKANKKGSRVLKRVAKSGGYTVFDGARAGKTFATHKEAISYAAHMFLCTGEILDVAPTNRQITHTFEEEEQKKK